MKTNKLLVEYNYDFVVFGLISSCKAYKLAWELNRTLKFHLVKADDLYFNFIKEGEICIINYIHKSEHWLLRFLKNKSCEHTNSSKPFLLPELKNYDYFIHLSGELSLIDIDLLGQNLKTISMIEYVKKVEVEKLKSKENLIF